MLGSSTAALDQAAVSPLGDNNDSIIHQTMPEHRVNFTPSSRKSVAPVVVQSGSCFFLDP
jgi:hypothetical protein